MAQIFWSAAEAGFFSPVLHPVLLADAVQVSPDTYTSLMQAQAEGRKIISDASGAPIAIEPVPVPLTMQAMRDHRDWLIGKTDWLCARHADEIASSTTPTLTPAAYAGLLAYRSALRALPETYPDPTAVLWPALPEGLA